MIKKNSPASKRLRQKIQSDSDVLVVIGIGGSYLGARAAIEALKGTLYNNTCKGTPQIFYVGNSISPAYLQSVLDACEGKDISVNVISKSGTTTEPALAFRIFKALLEKKYGKDGAKGRIYATTDKARGTLKELSADEGYETFVVPDDVGGRYSVLTAERPAARRRGLRHRRADGGRRQSTGGTGCVQHAE